MPAATRESDERILRWLAMSDAGWKVPEIAEHEGATRKYVEATLYRIRKADKEAHA